MKKLYGFGRIVIVFIPAVFFAGIVYPEFFARSGNGDFYFVKALIWAFASLHLVVLSMQLMSMLTGRRYQKLGDFSVVKVAPFSIRKGRKRKNR
jgi:hypothetical protein